jgi:hypothetical protein
MGDGLCECGCGRQTRVANKTVREKGWVKGQPLRYIKGHNHQPHSEESKRKMSRARMGVGLGRTLPESTRRKMGEARKDAKNSQWKGDEAGYHAIHIWVTQNHPKTGTCEHCGKKAAGRPHDYANVSGRYFRDRSDWLELCRPCHKTMDVPVFMARRAQLNQSSQSQTPLLP